MRMLGRTATSWCPYCRYPAGIDCPDSGRQTRQARKREKREWQREAGGA